MTTVPPPDPFRPPEEHPPPPLYGQPQYGQPQYGQPQYGQPQYGQPQYGQMWGAYPHVHRSTNGFAIASMVLGILWIYWIGSVLALVFGYIARSQIRQTGQGGDGMAIAGIVLGWVGLGFFLFFVLAFATLVP